MGAKRRQRSAFCTLGSWWNVRSRRLWMKRMIHRCYSSCYHPCSDGLMIFNHSLAMFQESKRWLFVGSCHLGHRFACPFGQSPGRPSMPWPPLNPIMIMISILFPIQTWQKIGGKCHEMMHIAQDRALFFLPRPCASMCCRWAWEASIPGATSPWRSTWSELNRKPPGLFSSCQAGKLPGTKHGRLGNTIRQFNTLHF